MMRDVRYVYNWSRMFTIEEFQNQPRIANLTFHDFIELLARMADIASYPTNDELAMWGKVNGHYR